jgi:delta 1-pyrroline-5-carboxylate dehydrogenase
MTDGINASVRNAAAGALSWSVGSVVARGRALFEAADVLEGSCTSTGIRNVVDAVRWYAGWADKFEAVGGTLNATPGPHRSETRPVALGTVLVFVPVAQTPLSAFADVVAPALVAGNGVVALFEGEPTAEERDALNLLAAGPLNAALGVHFGVSSRELPGLVVAPEVDAVAIAGGPPSLVEEVERASAETMVRTIVLAVDAGERGRYAPNRDSDPGLPVLSLRRVLRFTEPRTIWRAASS